MNVTVENLAPCKKLMRVEVETEKVEEAFTVATKEFRKHAQLPGFRPGKAPVEMVVRKYAKDIEDEAKAKLISDSYKQAVADQAFDVLGRPDIEEIQFERGKPLHFAATIETSPDFELPEYKGIPVKREARTVTDEDVAQAIEALRQQRTTFTTVQRPAQTGDAVVVNYTGTCEGKPIIEWAPTAKGLNEQKNFWVEVGGTGFIPGFGEQLLGAKAGDQRTVTVDYPADFVTSQVAGKRGVYAVEVVEIKEKVLPPVDDTLATAYGAENLEKLRAGVRRDLENELNYKHEKVIRGQIIRSLLNRVNFDLPETALALETRNAVYDIVQENARRGISRELIEKEKEKIYSAAAQGARERVKLKFILQKVAEKEDIKVSQEEISQRVVRLAGMYQIPPEQFLKSLQERNALIEIFDQVMNEKVLELLQQQAKVEEVPAGSTGGSA